MLIYIQINSTPVKTDRDPIQGVIRHDQFYYWTWLDDGSVEIDGHHLHRDDGVAMLCAININ